MKSATIVVFVVLTGIIVEAGIDWIRYKKHHKKKYTNPEEEMKRRGYWERNRTFIERHNTIAAKNSFRIHYRLKETPLTEYGWSALQQITATFPPADLLTRKPRPSLPFPSSFSIPDAVIDVDHRNSRCMPKIKTQKLCGACWAFAATTPVEFQSCMKHKQKIPLILSEQQLIDCASTFGNNGCDGGWYEYAWKYIQRHGQVTNQSYPYQAKIKPCKYGPIKPQTGHEGKAPSVIGNLTNYFAVGRNNETVLKMAVAVYGPVSASICATCPTFLNYGSGIYEDRDPACNCPVNHGVSIVGYGTSFGVDYWIIRNSWGPTWGLLAGYALLRRGINQNNIAFWPSLPLLA